MDKWLNFEFNTCEKLASIKGTVCGICVKTAYHFEKGEQK